LNQEGKRKREKNKKDRVAVSSGLAMLFQRLDLDMYVLNV
jgi:hypothetical protein